MCDFCEAPEATPVYVGGEGFHLCPNCRPLIGIIGVWEEED